VKEMTSKAFQYIFMVYKELYENHKNGMPTVEVVGIFDTMEKARRIQKFEAMRLRTEERFSSSYSAVLISQIPMNLHFPTHSDYVMTVA
jgi:hypothetical protein